ncbi:hypothetical protein K488DRAFT_83873 [Vararia minispora EC-137]|uniref:Uncharacterized protein n=1 Tax=Vararia minispora EC-137 TaxID=1314806 RepID=A0ACB8QSC4_9AGAM|nr:hypothetical protein K488DRAFT_83873 [Vararia minispora EC-137]
MDSRTSRPSVPLDRVLQSQKRRCYVVPGIRAYPEHPDMLYLEYSLKAQNWQDAETFWREYEKLKLPDNEYDMFLQAWERQQNIDSNAHPFLPRKLSIYAETSAHARVRQTGLDIPYGGGIPIERYTRSSMDHLGVTPMLTVNNPGPLLPPAGGDESPSDALPRFGVDFSAFTFGKHRTVLARSANETRSTARLVEDVSITSDSEGEDDDDDTWLPVSQRTLTRLQSTPPTSTEVSPAKPRHPASSPAFPKRRLVSRLSSPSPSDDSSGDEYGAPRAPKRKRRSAPNRPAKQARSAPRTPSHIPSATSTSASAPLSTSASAPPAALAFQLANPDCPPLPAVPNARGRWPCPHADCAHETGAFGDLLRHLESLAHQPEKKHRCGTCGCTFTRVDALKRHRLKRPGRCKQIGRAQSKTAA